MNRRDVVQRIVVGGTVLVFVPSVLQSCLKDPMIDTGSNPNGGITGSKITIDLSLPGYSGLNTTGSSIIIQNILVINTGNGFKALSSVCTHQGCTVGYDPSSGSIGCPCHGSLFAISGSVINGPATMPLQSFAVSQTGTVLTISI